MRKFILMTAMLLASATAQAGQSRNLSPVAANDEQPAVTTTTAQPARAAEVVPPAPPPPAMQYQAPVTPPDPPAPASPSYEVRPAPVTPTTTTEAPPLAPQPTTANPSAKSDTPRKTAKADRGRRGRGGNWSEARIIGELHRYGIYW